LTDGSALPHPEARNRTGDLPLEHSSPRRVSFGDVILDLDLGTLARDGMIVELRANFGRQKVHADFPAPTSNPWFYCGRPRRPVIGPVHRRALRYG
jgi:hypothetical protein